MNLRYEDDPTTPQDQDGVVYTALLRAGNVWFAWDVTQQVAQPVAADNQTIISVTDSTTPVSQTLTLNSSNSSTQIQGPARITEVLLRRQTQSYTNRFTNQQYSSIITLSNQGTGGSTKSIKATFSLPDQTLRYGIISLSGQIGGIQSTDPGFSITTQQSNINLTFPQAFANTTVPDVVLPEGTSMITTIKASNSFGETTLNSNSLLPELPDVVAYPTPDYVGSELTQ